MSLNKVDCDDNEKAMRPASSFPNTNTLSVVALVAIWWHTHHRCSVVIQALEHCSAERGGGVCPTGNTCCKYLNSADNTISFVSSSCIPNDLGPYNATCCADDNGKTGCAIGYTCGADDRCLASRSVYDPLVQILPRYHLCQSSPHLQQVYGLPIQAGNDAKVAYHSSRGDIINPARNTRETTRIAVVVVHGSGRNADDYFCSMQSAAELVATQRQGRDAGSILVIAPRFPIESDSDLDLINGGTALRWSDADANGPWRYGASAVYPPYVTQQGPFSSFEAMDHLVQALGNASTFPRLDRISIVGHSSGGQFVQRWSLLTPVWETMYINMRVVVMNPSSFAYLTPLRFINRKWRLPDQDCPNYNQWEWGFDPNANQSEYSIPYVQSVVNKLGIDRLTRRFALRTAVYLVGGQDVCNISSSGSSSSSSSFEWNSRFTRAANMASIVPSSPWCNSHGLETTCGDMLQGAHRVDRFRLYLDMLEQIAGLPRVLGAIVPGVGHDHSLMFHSNIGLRAIFGGTDQFGSTERWANGMSLLDH